MVLAFVSPHQIQAIISKTKQSEASCTQLATSIVYQTLCTLQCRDECVGKEAYCNGAGLRLSSSNPSNYLKNEAI